MCVLCLMKMTLEREAVRVGEKDKSKRPKITIANGRCWPGVFFSSKIDETRNSNT